MGAPAEALDELLPALPDAIHALRIPIFVVRRSGVIAYLNDAALEAFGDVRGERFTAFLAPDSFGPGEAAFASKIVGSVRTTTWRANLRGRGGKRIAGEINSVALERDHRIVGVFGLVAVDGVAPPRQGAVRLTPRQNEVLHHLAMGCTTRQMAEAMGVTEQTVRNHVRDLLKRLGVHSRLEAVVRAHELGLI
jgi:DNA-binding CsgD family transcriptional regulator